MLTPGKGRLKDKIFIPYNIECQHTVLNLSALDVEIGPGVGWHPIQYATKHPERQLIGIEHTAEKFAKFKRRANNHRLTNLFPVHANAVSYLAAFFEEASIDRVLIKFPNPYPKPSQKAKRFHSQSAFMELLHNLLKPNGTLTIETNKNWYAEEAAEDLKAVFSEVRLSTYVDSSGRLLSHFEQKYLASKQKCYSISAS